MVFALGDVRSVRGALPALLLVGLPNRLSNPACPFPGTGLAKQPELYWPHFCPDTGEGLHRVAEGAQHSGPALAEPQRGQGGSLSAGRLHFRR